MSDKEDKKKHEIKFDSSKFFSVKEMEKTLLDQTKIPFPIIDYTSSYTYGAWTSRKSNYFDWETIMGGPDFDAAQKQAWWNCSQEVTEKIKAFVDVNNPPPTIEESGMIWYQFMFPDKRYFKHEWKKLIEAFSAEKEEELAVLLLDNNIDIRKAAQQRLGELS